MKWLDPMRTPRRLRLKGEIEKVSDELDKMNGELLKLIDDESQKALGKLEVEMT